MQLFGDNNQPLVKQFLPDALTNDGKPIDDDAVRWVHELVCKKARIENFTFHDFRHTCINNWMKEGNDYFKIMAASGHKAISVFKRYNMVNEEELKSLVKSWLNCPSDLSCPNPSGDVHVVDLVGAGGENRTPMGARPGGF